MTPRVKRYITLDKQIISNGKKAEKFESGRDYDLTKRDIWNKKKEIALKKQKELNLSNDELREVNKFYGCYEEYD